MSTLPDQEQVRKVFDSWARDGLADGMETGHRDVVLQMLDYAQIQPHHHVLDVGCGTGWTVRLVAGLVKKGRAFGIDVADEMVHQAQAAANPPNVAFTLAPIHQLPYADTSLNRVISMESVYYWPDVDAGFAEVFRVLRPGGQFWAAIEFFSENTHTAHWPKELGLDLVRLSGPEYEERLQNAGFEKTQHLRLRDRRPPKPKEDFKPSQYVPNYEHYLETKKAGALLIHGVKPGEEEKPTSAGATSPQPDKAQPGGYNV